MTADEAVTLCLDVRCGLLLRAEDTRLLPSALPLS